MRTFITTILFAIIGIVFSGNLFGQSVTISGATEYCAGQTISLTASCTDATAYEWTKGTSSTSIGSNNVLTISNATSSDGATYNVVATTASGTASASVSIKVFNSVSISLNTDVQKSSNKYCKGNKIELKATLSGSSTSGGSYTWSKNSSTLSTSSSYTINSATTSDAGTYKVTVNFSSGCSLSASKNITVDNLQAPSVSITSDKNYYCEPDEAVLTSIVNENCTYRWHSDNDRLLTWRDPDSYITDINASSTNVELIYPNLFTTGTDDFWLIVTSTSNSCKNRADISLDVRKVSSATARTGRDGSNRYCVGETINLYPHTTNLCPRDSYSWSGPDGFTTTTCKPTISNATTTKTGTYTVTATDHGCSTISSVYVEVIPTPELTVSPTEQTICYGNSAELILSTTNNYSIENVTWNDETIEGVENEGNIHYSVSPEETTTYTIEAQVANACTVSTNARVNISPYAEILANKTINDHSVEYCEGETITLRVSDIATNYSWSGPAITSNISGNREISFVASASTQGRYELSANDANGCETTDIVFITVYSPIQAVITGNDTYCNGETITLSGNDNTAGNISNYSWTYPNGSTFSGSSSSYQTRSINSGTYCTIGQNTFALEITSNGGCKTTATKTVTIIDNPAPTITANKESKKYCVGETIVLTSSDASGYSWTGPNSISSDQQILTIPNITTSNAGTYYVTVDNGNGCSATSSVSISVSDFPSATITATNGTEFCHGTTLKLSVPSASSYKWANDNNSSLSTSRTLTVYSSNANYISGTYSVTVTNSYGCSATNSVDVTIYDNPKPTITANKSSKKYCVGETIELTSSDASGYSWTGPNSISSDQQILTIPNITTSNAGTYYVTVDNGNGCSATSSVSISVSDFPSATITATNGTEFCHGTTLSLSVPSTSSASYKWANDNNSSLSTSNTFTVSSSSVNYISGTYTVTVTTNYGCSATNSVDVTINPTPTASIIGTKNFCLEDTESVTIDLSSEYTDDNWTYNWSYTGGSSQNSSIQIPNATPENSGTYSLTVTNGSSCTASTSVDVNISEPINTFITGARFYTYYEALLSVFGGFDFEELGVASENYCKNDSLILLPTPLNADVLNESFDYTYIGPDGSEIENSIIRANQSHNGTYQLIVSNDGCSATYETELNVLNQSRPTLSISAGGPYCTNDIISGAPINITASGASNYAWIYPVEENGVESIGTSLVNPLTLSVINGGEAISPSEGPYYLFGKAENGCFGFIYKELEDLEEEVTIYDYIDPTISGGGEVCEGLDVNLSVEEGENYTYEWEGPNGFRSTEQNPIIHNSTNLNAGPYYVTITNANGLCSATSNINVTIQDSNIPNISTDPIMYCNGGSISLDIAGVTVNSWNGPNNTYNSATVTINPANSSHAGIYTANVTDGSCSGTVSIEVVDETPSISITSNAPICDGRALQISATEFDGATYTWSGSYEGTSSDNSVTIASPTNNGTYNVTADINGCLATATTSIIVNPESSGISISGESSYCLGETIELHASPVYDNVNYKWTLPNGTTVNTSQDLDVLANSQQLEGNYSVSIEQNGCNITSYYSRWVNISGTWIEEDIIADNYINNEYLWIGKNSSDWNDPTNWYSFDGSKWVEPENPPTEVNDVQIEYMYVYPSSGRRSCVNYPPIINDENAKARNLMLDGIESGYGPTVLSFKEGAKLTVNGMLLNEDGYIDLNNGTLDIRNYYITTTSRSQLIAGNGTLILGGGVGIMNGNFDPGTGTVVFNGNGSKYEMSDAFKWMEQEEQAQIFIPLLGLFQQPIALMNPELPDVNLIFNNIEINTQNSGNDVNKVTIIKNTSDNQIIRDAFINMVGEDQIDNYLPPFSDLNILVKGNVTLTNGIIDGDIILNENATFTGEGGNNNSFVDGMIIKYVEDIFRSTPQEFTFPTGDEGIYAPLKTTLLTNTAVQYQRGLDNITISNNDLPEDIVMISNLEHWKLLTDNNSVKGMQLFWNGEPALHGFEMPGYAIDSAFLSENLEIVYTSGNVDDNNLTWHKMQRAETDAVAGNVHSGSIKSDPSAEIDGSSDVVYITFATKDFPKEDFSPIELIAFSAECYDTYAEIQWTTATETNNDYFSLEKSADAVNFREIARIEGAGNSIVEQNYSFTDFDITSGNTYYRLRQVDYDGQQSVSNIIVVNCKADEISGEPVLSAYPNPFKNEINIKVENIAEDFTIEIFDNVGRLIMTKDCVPSASEYETRLNFESLPPSVYNVRVSSQSHIINASIIKQ